MSDARFDIEREGPNSLRIALAGSLDAQTMEVALQRLTQEMDGMEHGDMLMLDQGAEWPSLGAIGVELRHWPQLLAMLHKLDRCALVTHNQMFRNAAAVESALIPGYEIRSFNDEASARAWLAEARAAPA
ncbi:STAS/SEC14 domain-containing protein [Hasllibacter sp. MH4015]|uniref:STAS/SEC14 domain-containing protein n=1 Tax=Hasllibacter sp. MH4015 TaxID=2854029 RepID=UPI001CD2E6A4|nr:STAS/SEC14 domain-containing protein [Hasllibacter sp. MH4015]